MQDCRLLINCVLYPVLSILDPLFDHLRENYVINTIVLMCIGKEEIRAEILMIGFYCHFHSNLLKGGGLQSISCLAWDFLKFSFIHYSTGRAWHHVITI